MKNTTKKLLVLVAVVAVMVAALTVSAFAYVSWDEATSSFPGGTNSAYADINTADWVQVAAKSAKDADGDGAYTSEGDLVKGNDAFRAYFNESTGTLVIENDSPTSITGGNTDHSKVNMFANWAKTNAEKVTTLELRNTNRFNNAAYVIDKLTSVKTVKLYDKFAAWNGSKSDTGAFKGLAAMDTLLWGDWDKATGEFTKTLGEEGVIDLRGVKALDVMATTYNGAHTIMYAGSALAGSGAKKIILPYSQAIRDPNRTYNLVVISDGTETYTDLNQHASNSAYGTIVGKGKPCNVIKNKTTGEISYTAFWAIDTANWENVEVIAAEDEFGGDYTGIIPYCFAKNATALAEVVVPANVTLEYIEAEAFSGCSALKVIDIRGAVAADLRIENKNAFNGVSGLTIKVYSDMDKANLEAALTAAGVTGVTVETTKVEEPDGGETVAIPNVITADGFMLRTKSYNGLRALFSFDEAKAEAVATETGYTLVEYGAIAASAASLETAGDAEALFAMADGKKIQRIVIYDETGTGLNKYVDVDAKQYCIAVRDFVGANALKEIYVAGYAMWSDGTNTVITFSEYTTKAGKNTISLYTLTLEMYKAGVVNAQNTDDVCLWNVLQNGALAVTEAETKAPSELLTLTQGYEYDADGKFTYLDLPLRAWKMYTNASGKTVWNSRGTSVEAESTTGILWSVLVDGDDYVVVYRADPAAESSALPTLSDSYGASAPYSSYYFYVSAESHVTEDPTANGLLKTATIYSPIFTDENAAKVKTLVIDYGVDKFGSQPLDDSKKSNAIGTIVYPEGMTAGNYILAGASNVEDFIYATADKSYLDAYAVDSLVDLTGLAKVGLYGITQNAASIKNLLLPTSDKLSNGEQYGFGGAKALLRAWTVGSDMPEAGTMDLSQTTILLICKGYFNNLDCIDDIIMPETFKGVNSYSMATLNQKTDSARWNIFGNNSSETKLNIHVFTWDALNCIANTFYDAHQNPDHNDGKEVTKHIVDYLQITYEGVTKTVLEWRADFPAQPTPAE